MKQPASAGTVYGLTDPRNGETRYIGATRQPLARRLTGHLNSKSRRVRSWVDELKAAGLRPEIVPIHENVPAGELKDAEDAEITRILSAGGTLLNESGTARGRDLNYERHCAERELAEQAGWAELAAAALSLFGGPLAPGDLPGVAIPDVSWSFMSRITYGREEYMHSLIAPGLPHGTSEERHRLWIALHREQEEAGIGLWRHAGGAWSLARQMGGRDFDNRMERYFASVAKTPCSDRADAARHLALIVWYMVAVCPWRHLAEISGHASSDGDFIAWAARDAGTRDALEFLAARHSLGYLDEDWEGERWHSEGPGRLLATTSAAYVDATPADAIRGNVVGVLSKLAGDHQLTSPMADLLVRLDPKALDTAFGPDIAARIDDDLGLAPGVSGQVIRALAERLRHSPGKDLQRIADRSAQKLPVVPLPEYSGWYGPIVMAARVVGAHLVQAGLGESQWKDEDYLTRIRDLWAPETRDGALHDLGRAS